MSMHDVDGLNAGYASALFEQYLENPAAVPTEWRALFESGASELVATHPGLARLVELLREDGNGHVAAPTPPAAVADPAPPAPAPVAVASEPGAVETEARRVAAPDETLLAASPRRWRSSRRIACTATSPPASTRSAPSRSATRRSSPSGWSRR